MSFECLLDKTISIYRRSFSADEYGRKDSTWNLINSSYKCRFYKPTDETTIEEEGQVIKIDFKVIGGLSPEIQDGDKLVDGSEDYVVRRVYKVSGKTSAHHYQLLVTRI